MITRVTIKNFKKLTQTTINLDEHVVFAGPNNSGKTTAIQALAVWRLALTKWLEKRGKAKSKATLRTGVAISRPDLIVLPLRDMKFLWHDCEVQDSENKKIRAEIVVEYYNGLSKKNGRNPHTKLDLGMGGSGFHQVLLLLAFLYDQAGTVLLFDEPDAHLEIIRQRDVYRLLRRLAGERDAQLIISTHSEVILDETAHTNICAFLGDNPRPLASSQEASQLRKALVKIPSSDYLQAKERCGVLYVEDYTDIDILLEWARVLEHPAISFPESPFVVYAGNVPKNAREHFYKMLGKNNAMPKSKFYRLAAVMKKNEVHSEVSEKLDRIASLVGAK